MKQFAILIFLLSYLCLLAQDIEVKKFEPMVKDQTDRISIRNDNNGNPCALLIVHSLKKCLEFEGWVVGDVEYEDDTYRVFIANGAKHIKIKHPDCQTKDVTFNEYNIISLKPGTVYELYLVDDTKDIIDKVYSLGWNLKGFDVPEKAKTILKMTARRGEVKAMVAMAQLSVENETKELVEQNQGLYWIKQLLENGDSTCLDSMPGKLMCAYGFKAYLDKFGCDTCPDPTKTDFSDMSMFLLRACLKGYKTSGDDFFTFYIQSNGLPAYRSEVLRLCLDSASVGNSKAMTCLGHIYEAGLCENMDLKVAVEWFRKSDMCNPSAQSKTDLCRVYGNKLYPIDNASLNYIKQQASEGLTEALYQLGYMYEEGRNVEKNIEKAVELYKQSKHRHRGATYRLAKFYFDRKDYSEVENLLRGLDEDELDARYLQAMILFQKTYNSAKVDAYNILSDLSKKGYQKATDFIKNNLSFASDGAPA